MMDHTLTANQINAFGQHLLTEERSSGTIEKYLRDANAFAHWLDGAPVTKELSSGWKEHLRTQGYAPATINSMLAALNGLFRFLGWDECRVKFLKIQRLTDGDNLCYRHPGQRSAVSYRGGRPAGKSGNFPQGEDPHHPLAGQALPETAEICWKTQNRLWRDFSYQKRKQPLPPTDLGRAETVM